MFVDEIKVFARAGHGGKGCVAFLREPSRPKGGPSGGNGGRGGDVILEADHDLNNLVAQFFNPRLIAPDGQPGLGKGMDGHAGRDLIVKVPCGTLVWRLDSVEPALEGADSWEVGGTLPASSSRRSKSAKEKDCTRRRYDACRLAFDGYILGRPTGRFSNSVTRVVIVFPSLTSGLRSDCRSLPLSAFSRVRPAARLA